ncbi:MAG: hypothetical protein ABGZ19_01060 [Verrucomicrobiales bacterium]|nr:hypothetical protein [Methyloprofundus sp.]
MKHIGLFSALIISGFLGGGSMALAHVDADLPCYATVDADLNVTIPCLEVNGGFHSAILEPIQNPLIGGKLEWQLRSYTEGGGLTLGTANGTVGQSSNVIGIWQHDTSKLASIPPQVTGPTILFNGFNTYVDILNNLSCANGLAANNYFKNTKGDVYITVGGGLGHSGWTTSVPYDAIDQIVAAVQKGSYTYPGWCGVQSPIIDLSMVTGIAYDLESNVDIKKLTTSLGDVKKAFNSKGTTLKTLVTVSFNGATTNIMDSIKQLDNIDILSPQLYGEKGTPIVYVSGGVNVGTYYSTGLNASTQLIFSIPEGKTVTDLYGNMGDLPDTSIDGVLLWSPCPNTGCK